MSLTETESVVAVLKQTRTKLIQMRENPSHNEPRFKWRVYEDTESTKPDYDNMIWHIEQQIIDAERSLRDPEQDAEMLMEKRAEMALMGERGDASAYFHTPFQEALFQEQIRHDIDYGYYDDDGCWNDGLYGDGPSVGDCPACGTQGVWWEDEGHTVDGHDVCHNCSTEAIIFMNLLGFITNRRVESNRWETEYSFAPIYIARQGVELGYLRGDDFDPNLYFIVEDYDFGSPSYAPIDWSGSGASLEETQAMCDRLNRGEIK
jgi:hypothetical protein